MTHEVVVGIDLGTTNTAVAWAERRAGAVPEIFALPQWVSAAEARALPLLPSFLYAPLPEEQRADPWGDAPWVIGEHARARGTEVAGRTVLSAKSWLCHAAVDRTAQILPWGTEPSDMIPRLSPVEASARILQHVRQAWGDAFPDRPLAKQQVVLTVPASFDQDARSLTLEAARGAGLTVRLLEEPQAAFYDAMASAGIERLRSLLDGGSEPALVLVCDVGGGTTDLTLIRVGPTSSSSGQPEITRVAVGRHLLLGGDNMDLGLAHVCESRMLGSGAHLDARRFAQLTLACRSAKERLLGEGAPESIPIALAASGSALVGNVLRTELGRGEVEQSVLEGFFPFCARSDVPKRGRSGLLAFGLPYEHDPAITRHVALFLARHAADAAVRGVLFNGGVFRASRIAGRVLDVLRSWSDQPCERLPEHDPDLAVARGAVLYGLALAGHGVLIGGGAAHGYYIGIESGEGRRAICIVPRGSREGERHRAAGRVLGLRVGRPVRFELYSSDSGPAHAPGEVVEVDDDDFTRLPAVATRIEADPGHGGEVKVALEGELSPIGTLELGCVETDLAGARELRRFGLAFELRSRAESIESPRSESKALSERRPRPSLRPARQPFEQARVAVERVFGKAQADVREREVKDLMRELVRLLGERESWSGELTRALFDVVAPLHKSRRRSPDHERVFWMLAGYCLRPGWGHPLDPERIAILSPLFEQGVTFHDEARSWQQLWIAWRRVSGGLRENLQQHIRDRVDPFLAPPGSGRKKPKGFKPQALDEMLELASSLERVPSERRVELGEWLLERTWTEQNPRLWAALGRLGSRAPAYGSVHHVVSTRVAERWLDQLLREKWQQVATAPRAAMQLARVTGDRARDVSEALRARTIAALEQVGADPSWIRAVREHVEVADRERAEFFGEELPAGLRLVNEPS